jgi:O-acetyl-ADP-ribose deacetylase (regulator of RNase III)
MSFSERKGDIFLADDLEVIAHGVNCRGLFGAGFALEVAKRYRWAKDEYVHAAEHRQLKPGAVVMATSDFIDEPAIAHLCTQDRPGPDAKLRWVAESVARLLDDLSYNAGNPRIGMPRIGCGIGGLEWVNVRMILEVLGNEYDGELVVFSL